MSFWNDEELIVHKMILETQDYLLKLKKFRNRHLFSHILAKKFSQVLSAIEEIHDNKSIMVKSVLKNEYHEWNDYPIEKDHSCNYCMDARQADQDYVRQIKNNNDRDVSLKINGCGNIDHLDKSEDFYRSLYIDENKINNFIIDYKVELIYNNLTPLFLKIKSNWTMFTGIIERMRNVTKQYPSWRYFLVGSSAYGSQSNDSTFDIYIETCLICLKIPMEHQTWDYVFRQLVGNQQLTHNMTIIKIFLRVFSKGANYMHYGEQLNEKIYFENFAKLLVVNNEWEICSKAKNICVPSNEIKCNALGIKCNFLFRNGAIMDSQAKLTSYLLFYPILRKLCSAIRSMNRSLFSKFNNYTITMLVIFYYQVKRVIPPVFILQNNIPTIFSGPWQINFRQVQIICDSRMQMKLIDNFKNFQDELQEFFEFYNTFDFKKFAICPYLGQPVEKSIFYQCAKTQMPNFIRYYLINPALNNIDLNGMCIQDPMEQNRNIASYIDHTMLEEFADFCHEISKRSFTVLKPRYPKIN